MAELSAETKAIIDRLKAEGDLIRNSGTNSVRAVKVQLDRFEGIFKTISANTVEQTSLLQRQMGIAETKIEAEKSKEQFDELQREKVEKASKGKDDSASKEKTNKLINNIGDGIKKALSFKNLLIGGAGLFVGYNVLKGFIDEKTDGGFTRMIDSFKEIDWAGFKDKFNSMINAITRFEDWLGGLPGLLIGGGLVGVGARNLGMGLLAGRSNAAGGPRRVGLMGIRGAILTAVTGLAIAYGDDVKDWLTEQAGVNPDVANFTVDSALTVAGGATIAAMFGLGPAGILIGAGVGLAYVIGKEIYNWIERNREQARIETQRRMDALDNIFGTGTGSTEAGSSGLLGDVTGLANNLPGVSTAQIAQRAEATGAMTAEDLANAASGNPAAIEKVAEAMTFAAEDIARDYFAARSAEINPRVESFGDRMGESGFNLAGSREFLENLNALAGSSDVALSSQGRNAIQRLKAIYGGSAALPGMEAFGDLTADEQAFVTELSQNQYRKGTGFKDFGKGTFAVLHGKEAVVPFNTAAGRFLDTYFTDNFQPKVRANNGSASVGMLGSTVVINAPTTVAPNVNYTHGGNTESNLNVLNVGGSGGGGNNSLSPFVQ